MPVDFDPSPDLPGYVYIRLADHVEQQIDTGKIPVGSRLASASEMAETYGVALGTVRRALDVLRERGLIRTWPAKGSFVTERRPAPGDDAADT
ncbi:winged helix-turn-helix domain-containing protein [Jiangella sp. DSM 45060]|uniref:GntR family transcriptional regulator n=1 Tax=Jiangella sp. DSM 45060 TaxID=1798224 RepID=UPI000879D6A0|nr:winged helix-turn-helix domain-containing protein [Jiangella sp. DSM 45060]SDT36956.1 regulatory protein, gntR family [Jiangella sp. DSM 45060]